MKSFYVAASTFVLAAGLTAAGYAQTTTMTPGAAATYSRSPRHMRVASRRLRARRSVQQGPFKATRLIPKAQERGGGDNGSGGSGTGGGGGGAKQ